ncbi:MAG: 5'/3'-nucleotidase SurE [Candidatus Heimdallarchaeota archaeon]|nr:5'/3'-nucleotidase SurE [Candidatus Heimdallarchaeota archaeon]
MKKILLCNDDGISAPGLKAIYQQLKEWAEVKVIAPEIQRSGESKSLTFNKPIRMYEVDLGDGKEGYTITGTAADAVIFGLNQLKKDRPFDLVVSGINAGENTSCHSILTSGTCAAAFEASFFDVPAVAFSLDVEDEFLFHNQLDEKAFETAAKLANKMIQKISNQTFPKNMAFLNVNFPAKVTEKTPIRITTLARTKYTNFPIARNDPQGKEYFWLWGDYIEELPEGSDSKVVLKDHEISITPIEINLALKEPKMLEELMEQMKKITEEKISTQ